MIVPAEGVCSGYGEVKNIRTWDGRALNRVKTRMLHFAWDSPREDLVPYFKRFLEMTSVKNYRKRRVYVLVNYGSTMEQDLRRIYTLRDMGYDPFVMVYEKPSAPPATRRLQQWVNNKRFFRTVPDFYDFDPAGRGKTHRERSRDEQETSQGA